MSFDWGDPAALGRVVVDAIEMDQPSAHLLVGPTAIERICARYGRIPRTDRTPDQVCNRPARTLEVVSPPAPKRHIPARSPRAHYHSRIHEVLGIARESGKVRSIARPGR
jgi:hypothetical protein